MRLSDFEDLLGFKNKIKWSLAVQVFAYHIFGVWWCWHYAFVAKPLTILFALLMFCLNMTGITCGAHRLFSHKSYKASTPLKIFLLICFTSGGQNSIYKWVRDHRLHHRHSDTEADPHNAKRGLFFSHIGWLITEKNEDVLREGKKTDMSDLENDKYVMFFTRYTVSITTVLTYILPPLVSIVFWGESWKCAVAWEWFIRYLTVAHGEFSVNSFAHTFGYQPYDKNIMPKQNKIVSFFALGEGWHNYHHVFPFDYKAAEFCDFLNLSATVIRFWAKMGLAWDLKEASPEMVKSVCERLGEGVKRTTN